MAVPASVGHAQQAIDDVLEGFDEEPPPAPPAGPDGEPNLERDLEGFDDLPAGPRPASRTEPPPRRLRFGGGVSQQALYSYAHGAPSAGDPDHRGLSGLRVRVDGELDLTISPDWSARLAGYAFYDPAYRVAVRDGFPEAFLDEYESDADIGEAYVQGRLFDDLDIRVGRQVVVWGKSDNIRVTDILNPLDVRLPGLTDIEDLRLPATMTRLDYFVGDWNLSAIAVHEIRFDKTPVFGSDFFTAPAPLPPRDDLEEGFDDQEYAVALNGIFPGWDLSLYGAYVFDDRAHLQLTPDGLRRRHSRLAMGGLAANAALGNWLLKGEAAYFDGIEFFAEPGETFARLDVLAGVEYSGFRDTTLSFEVANRHLFGFAPALEASPDAASEDEFETAVRLTQSYLNDTLQVTLVASTFGPLGQNGGLQRLQLSYDWTDSVEFTVGIVNYMSGDDRRFSGVGDNDRLFAEIEYQF